MARSVYITGLEPGGGKSTVALGVAELLSRRVQKLAVFRPLVREPNDPIVTLLRDRYQIAASAAGYGATYAEAAVLTAEDGEIDRLIEQILEHFRAISADADAVIVVGTDFGRESGESGLHEELALNARLATELGAVVLAVVDGRNMLPGVIAGAMRTAHHTLSELNTTVAAVIANRVDPPDRDEVLDILGALPVPAYVVPDAPTISAPTLADVADELQAVRLLGDDDAYGRDVLAFVMGAAHVPVLLDYLRDGCVVITPGDRADLITAVFAAHSAGLTAIAGVVLTLGEQPDPRVLELVRRMRTDVPIISVKLDSFETVSTLDRLEARLTTSSPRKIEAALGAFESHVDGDQLAARLDVAISHRVTPLMFEYALIEGARRQRRHVVLCEGTEERILRAAEILLRRGVAELTLLGPVDEVQQRARELGLDISTAHVVNPDTSEWRGEFADEYLRLRAHKGIPLGTATEVITEVNYFGTMMVHRGYADAMVSGATHPTADTIRPAFEIIRTRPGVSIASSVFFMCLADRVLVYGDCAINPDPNAEQLADIAISSAETAAKFGVEPRVAMLSYATGASGRGADVDKVLAATALVRQRRPDLPVEGPIQYDAAIDPTVAHTKLPDSPVAGRATVFIFPDLNTGNNTYKAVQRSADAVAVGPVLQGLRQPVNDLSRGATVADIVNTVAITAIQAQG